jgi:hypothetical protein
MKVSLAECCDIEELVIASQRRSNPEDKGEAWIASLRSQ